MGESENCLKQDAGISNIFSTRSLNDELAILGGQTCVLSRKTRQKVSKSSTPISAPEANPSSQPSTISISSSPFDLSSISDAYPSLIKYLKPDSIRRSHITPHLQILPSGISLPTTLAAQQMTFWGTKSPSHPNRDMKEIYSGFVGYLPDKSAADIPVPPGAVSPHIEEYQRSTQGNQTSKSQHLDSNTFTPSVINQSEEISPLTNLTGITTMHANLLNGWMALSSNTSPLPNQCIAGVDTSPMVMSSLTAPVQMDEALYQGQKDLLSFQNYSTASDQESNYFLGSVPSTQYQDSAEHMVEMGLTSESGMDEVWLSLMRECGIVDQEKLH